jgi:putative oxidoreductase
MKKWRKYLGWMGIILISLFFLQAGILKLIGDPRMIETFNNFGYSAWFRIAIGMLEIVGAISLLSRYSSRYGALLLAAILIGAITSGLVAGRSDGALLEVILLCCLVWIAVARKPDLRHKSKKETLHS